MNYGRFRKRYRAGGAKRSYKRRRSAPTPRRARRINARTAGFLGIEKKFFDQVNTGTAILATSSPSGGENDPAANCLNAIAQGDQESNRDGRKCMMKSVQVTGIIYQDTQQAQSAPDTTPICYIALVLDRQTNGAQLNSEDVFVNPSAQSGLGCSLLRNLQFISRFKVLKSAQIVLPQPTVYFDSGSNTTEASGTVTPFQMYVKLELPINFTGTTSTVANIVDNSLHIIAFCSANQTAPQLQYNSRVRFVG